MFKYISLLLSELFEDEFLTSFSNVIFPNLVKIKYIGGDELFDGLYRNILLCSVFENNWPLK